MFVGWRVLPQVAKQFADIHRLRAPRHFDAGFAHDITQELTHSSRPGCRR
jgi:hypothetical protein